MAGQELEALRDKLRQFAAERNWDRYHSPKNLAMALAGEAGELLEHFQWLTQEESRHLPPERLHEVAFEMADVLLYLIALTDKLGVDLVDAARRKIEINAGKYPAAQVRGSAKKYNDY